VKPLAILTLSLLLSACSLTPRQKAFVVGSVALSLALSLDHEDSQERRIPAPSNPCANAEACR
jgi:hypothetical protein